MGERRLRGEGAVYQRHDHESCPKEVDGERPKHNCRGHWVGVVDLGQIGGKRVRKTVTGHTLREVTAKFKALKKQLDAGVDPDNWTVEDGCIVGQHDRSHLFYMDQEFTDLEFKAEVKINKGGNSGMYFRAAFGGAGWPKGYEAQVNNSHTDWRRTGSLYGISDTKEQLIPDDTWWTQHIIVKGNRIVIKVNDKVVVDHVDQENRFQKGYLALQQHDPGSVVHYRNLQMREIPSTSQ